MSDDDEVWAPDPADVIPDGADVPATLATSGETFYPDSLQARQWWVNWVRAYSWDEVDDPEAVPTKQPTAPYRNGTAKPVKWNSGLSEKKYPSTDFETVEPWGGTRIGVDIHAPDRVISDHIGIGIIIPTDQSDERTITLIDWDDVRNPETGEIHPVCAWAINKLDGFAERSQSGEGYHQLVYGKIPGWSKQFIRHIATEPIVGDDLPQVEIYQSGRVTAMTGRHVAGRAGTSSTART